MLCRFFIISSKWLTVVVEQWLSWRNNADPNTSHRKQRHLAADRCLARVRVMTSIWDWLMTCTYCKLDNLQVSCLIAFTHLSSSFSFCAVFCTALWDWWLLYNGWKSSSSFSWSTEQFVQAPSCAIVSRLFSNMLKQSIWNWFIAVIVISL